jgi:hypothetical protein
VFESEEAKQRKLEEAYGKGIAKARETGALEGLLEAMGELVVPDSMGTEEYQSYKKGYHDVMIGKVKGKSTARLPEKEVSLTALEKAWYGLCNRNDFIYPEVVRRYRDQLYALGKHVTVTIGLHDFTEAQCPKCTEPGYYKIHFLGQLKHPECGTGWYMGPGGYIGFQFASVFHSGIQAGGSMKEDSDRKGQSGGWISGIFGFLFVAILRAALAFVLIPIQAVVSLSQSKPKA